MTTEEVWEWYSVTVITQFCRNSFQPDFLLFFPPHSWDIVKIMHILSKLNHNLQELSRLWWVIARLDETWRDLTSDFSKLEKAPKVMPMDFLFLQYCIKHWRRFLFSPTARFKKNIMFRHSNSCIRWFWMWPRGWPTGQQEVAVDFAIITFETDLKGNFFIPETDHRNLQFTDKFPNARMIRWELRLQEFDFAVHHFWQDKYCSYDFSCLIAWFVGPRHNPITVAEHDSNKLAVQSILAHRGIGRDLQFLVRCDDIMMMKTLGTSLCCLRARSSWFLSLQPLPALARRGGVVCMLFYVLFSTFNVLECYRVSLPAPLPFPNLVHKHGNTAAHFWVWLRSEVKSRCGLHEKVPANTCCPFINWNPCSFSLIIIVLAYFFPIKPKNPLIWHNIWIYHKFDD